MVSNIKEKILSGKKISYNEEGYSKETLFATGYYLVKEIKEVVVYEDEKTIFEQVDE